MFALRGEEVAPVLPDQPRPEEGGGLGAARQLPHFRDSAGDQNREDAESEHELVDPQPAYVDARAEPMPFQAGHPDKVDQILRTPALGWRNGTTPFQPDSSTRRTDSGVMSGARPVAGRRSA